MEQTVREALDAVADALGMMWVATGDMVVLMTEQKWASMLDRMDVEPEPTGKPVGLLAPKHSRR